MSTPLWEEVERWRAAYGVRTRRGVTDSNIRETERQIGDLPVALRDLYKVTNGISLNSFRIFPLFDSSDPKKTWDSLQRMNDRASSRYLNRDEELFARFIIFAEIGGGDCAALDRVDQSLWYEEAGELYQTDLDVVSFIETSLLEQGG